MSALTDTPPHTKEVGLTENARIVLEKRYLRRGPDGKPAETIHEMFWRVARHVAAAEAQLGGEGPRAQLEAEKAAVFYDMMTELRFLPNSPTFTGAGTPLGQLAACFVLPISDDMGADPAGIFQTLRDAALVQQTGGGNGFSFSRLRPKGGLVGSSMGKASGPVGFLGVFNNAFGEIAQGGTRRGANMAVLDVGHPDIESFVNCKSVEGALANFNISVGVTDAFMEAVERGAAHPLTNPHTGEVTGEVDARALFRAIATKAHRNGEPGVLFPDAANRANPVPHLYTLESTNPCVAGDTVVMTADGPRRADDLLGARFDAALGSGLHASTDAGFFRTGRKEVFDLALKSGHRLRLTADHQILVRRGGAEVFVAAGATAAGDEVCLARTRGLHWGARGADEIAAGAAIAKARSPWVAGSSDSLVGYLRGVAPGVPPAGGDFYFACADGGAVSARHFQSVLMYLGVFSRIVPDGVVVAGDSAAEYLRRVFPEAAGARGAANEEDPFVSEVESFEAAGLEDVYDCTVPEVHRFSANGIVAHNCGEQWLGPYESCCLGSINLAVHMRAGGGDAPARVDWALLRRTTEDATRFLDDVVTANAYVPAVPQLKAAAEKCRRLGLGIMGLADAMFACGVVYGSDEGQEFGAQLMEFVRFHTLSTSAALAAERGPFPALEGSVWDFSDSPLRAGRAAWAPPTPLVPHSRDWGRPALDWAGLAAAVAAGGVRNAAQNTIAPTGTISTIAGCEGYGCEPAFALAYTRTVIDGDAKIRLAYASPALEAALRARKVADSAPVFEAVARGGSCAAPEARAALAAAGAGDLAEVFVTSGDIAPEAHILQQAALQRFVDNSISKTINMPNSATVADVEAAYFLAWKQGCRGLTVYRTGSRDVVVLETAAADPVPDPAAATPRHRRQRPARLAGSTLRAQTPLGMIYVTVNADADEPAQPFEVFLQASKAGSDTAAVTEALGRLISHILRAESPVPRRTRLAEVAHQLGGIGGARSTGLGPKKVRSLPDGIAQMLARYLADDGAEDSAAAGAAAADDSAAPGDSATAAPGDLCPECGQATYVFAEGCKKCLSCGLSEC